jgi:hypothetical protein
MARVTYGSLITKLTGSIAGTTFQQNFSGSIARSKPNKIINPSNLLGSKQLDLAVLVSQWNQLTSSQKSGWNSLASSYSHTDPWGNVKKISGFQWFMSNNLNLAAINAGRIGDAPSYLLPPPPPSYSLLFQATQLLIQFSKSYDPTPYTLIIYATPPVRTTSLKTRIAVFIIDFGSIPSGADLDIASQYEVKFGYSLAQLLTFTYFTIVTRLCVIDPMTGFRSTYALNVSGNNPAWIWNQTFNTYPSPAVGSAYVVWGDGSSDTFSISGTFAYSHNYSDSGSHSVSITVTWSGGSASFSGPEFGNVGHIIIHLVSIPLP